jgi:hypothetical protein
MATERRGNMLEKMSRRFLNEASLGAKGHTARK